MDRTIADSLPPIQSETLELAEAYLFDQPDILTVSAWRTKPFPVEMLNNTAMVWDGRAGALLHRACADGRLVWVNALLEQGADPWLPCPEGLPPAAWAAQNSQTATFLRLLDEPVSLRPPEMISDTTLFHAIMAQSDPMMVEAFMAWWAAKGDVFHLALYDRPDAQGAHPTHLAAVREERAAETLQRLIEFGFSAHATDRYDMTPWARLHQAHPPAQVSKIPSRPGVPNARWHGGLKRAATRRRPS